MWRELYWVSFIAYSAAFLTNLCFFAFQRRILFLSGVASMAIALFTQAVALGLRISETGNLPLTNMYEYLLIFSLFSSVLYFVSFRFTRFDLIRALCAPFVFMIYVAASLFPKEPVEQLMPALQSYWLPIHIILAAAGEVAFLFSFVMALLFILVSSRYGNGFKNRLPDAEKLEDFIYRSIIIGYPLFTIGALFAGSVWAYRAWGAFWSWDPKEVCSLVVWLIYTFYLHARLTNRLNGKQAAWLAIVGFVATVLTLFSSMFLGGLHSYGV